MIGINNNLKELTDFFIGHNINILEPGFYDDNAFLAIEKSHPSILSSYASFVSKKLYKEDYLANAEKKISAIIEPLLQELEKDGRQGACIDVSNSLSRMLDREGIWNYVVKGCLKISFNEETKLTDKYFWAVDEGEFSAAHVWVVAPPFKIIDLTLRQQPYKFGEEKFIPRMVLQKEASIDKLELKDIVRPDILQQYFRNYLGLSDKQIFQEIMENPFIFQEVFPPLEFEIIGTNFKYSPTGIGASDVPLEEITSLKLNGKYPIDIYNNIKSMER